MVLRFIPLEDDGLSGDRLRKLDYPLQAHAAFTGLRYIFIKCPTTGLPVSTGLKAESVIFESLPAVAVPFVERSTQEKTGPAVDTAAPPKNTMSLLSLEIRNLEWRVCQRLRP